MLVDDLNQIKNSLSITYKDMNKIKAYTLLKFCKKVIISEQNNFSQTELLSIINEVFETDISYITFNKFFHSFIKSEKNKLNKGVKNEAVENKTIATTDNKSTELKSEVANKKDNEIVAKKVTKNNNDNVSSFIDLPEVENANVGLVESPNKRKIK